MPLPANCAPAATFAANPFGWHDFGQKKSGSYTLPSGESIRFRYRVVLHDGDTASAAIPRAFEAYVKPPEVEVRSESPNAPSSRPRERDSKRG